MELPTRKASQWVTPVPIHPCKRGMETLWTVTLGSPLKSGPGREGISLVVRYGTL